MFQNPILEHLDILIGWLLQTSWQASILVLLIFAVQWLFHKRFSTSWQYSLWLLLLLRLALPVAPESRFSVFNILSIENILLKTNNTHNLTPGAERISLANQGGGAIVFPNGQSGQTGNFIPSLLREFTLTNLLVGVWLFVVIFLFFRTVFMNFKLLRHAKKQRPFTKQGILDLLEDCKNEFKLHVPLSIVITDKISSPALLGFIRPRLLLPQNMIQSLSRSELRYVFLHELAHIKRLDIFVNWLITLAQIIHWFNPILWFAFNRMRSDMELACDALVLSNRQKIESKSYGRTIVKILEMTTKQSTLSGTVGLLEDKTFMKKRLKHVLLFPQQNKKSPLAATFVAILLACSVLTNASSPTHPVQVLEKMKSAYESRDLNALMGLFDTQAKLTEIDGMGNILATLDRAGIEKIYRQNLIYNIQFNYSDVVASGDSIFYEASFRSNLFEAVGLNKIEGKGLFVLKGGLIQQAVWREKSDLKRKRMEVFNQFLRWLKEEKQEQYESLFAKDIFLMHRATGEKVSELFFEWVASQTILQKKYGGFQMSNLPEVKKMNLDSDIITVCREFHGPFENSPQNTMEVAKYADSKGIQYEPFYVIGVYWGDPSKDKPEDLRSYHGVIVSKAPEVDGSYFVYTMKKGTEYLHTQVKGEGTEVIPAGYMAIFNYMGLNKIQAGSSGGHQLMKMVDGEMIFDIYLEIDK